MNNQQPKFTPAPWRATAQGGTVLSESGDTVALVAPQTGAMEREANARRIVAAVNACKDIPTEALETGVIDELVSALESLLRSHDACFEGREERRALYYAAHPHRAASYRKARAAVARARGIEANDG